MKHALLSLAIATTLLTSTTTRAQVPVVSKVLPKVTIGVKVGANMHQVTGETFDSKYSSGLMGGAFVGLTKGKIGVQGEVLVKSASFDIKGTSTTIKTATLDIPVLLEYKLISRLWIQVGPQFSALLSAKNGSTDIKKSFNSTDFAGVIGLQANLPLHLTAGARYVLGLTNINNESNTGLKETWNNRSIQLYLGFRFI